MTTRRNQRNDSYKLAIKCSEVTLSLDMYTNKVLFEANNNVHTV